MTDLGDGSPSSNMPNNIETALTPVIQEIIEKGDPPEQTIAEIVSGVRTVITRHRGPLPDPETLAAYSQLIPNGAERCMGLVEREAAHRQKQEDRIVSANVNVMVHGQWIGVGLTILLLGAAFFLGMHDHDWLAGAICTTTIIGVITVFVLRLRSKSDDDDDDANTDDDADTEDGKSPKDQSDDNSAATSQDRARQVQVKYKKGKPPRRR